MGRIMDVNGLLYIYIWTIIGIMDCYMDVNGMLMGCYPLVNVYKKLWKDPPF